MLIGDLPLLCGGFPAAGQFSVGSMAFVVCYFLACQCAQLYEGLVLGVTKAKQRAFLLLFDACPFSTWV